MYILEKIFYFSAGHCLVHHDGKCRQPHGHSYALTLQVASPTLIDSGPKTNMVMDFGDLSDIVEPMIDTYFDHLWLNDTLNNDSVSCEYIAKWVYEYLKPKIPLLSSVTIQETSTSKVTYNP